MEYPNKQPAILLVMQDAFHLGWMGATCRLFHLAKAFQTLGFELALLAGRATNPAVQYEIDKAFPGRVIRTLHSGDYPRLLDVLPFLRRCWRAGWKLRGEDVYWSKLSWGWAQRLDIEFVWQALEEQGVIPKLIWGVSAGYLEGAVASQCIAQRLGVPWVFELQDPPRRAGLGPDNAIVKKKCLSLLHDATRIVVVAESYGRVLRQTHEFGDDRLHTVHLTHDGKPLVNRSRKSDTFVLVYAGSLNGSQSIKPLIISLAAALNLKPEMRYSFRLELAGAGIGFQEVARLLIGKRIDGNIKLRGLISGNETGKLLQTAHALVVVLADNKTLQIPGKIFESLKAGKPIVGIMPKDCEAAEILRRSGLGFIHESRDIDGLRDSLICLWEAWRENQPLVEPNEVIIRDFSLQRLPTKLAHVLQGVLAIASSNGQWDMPEQKAGGK